MENLFESSGGGVGNLPTAGAIPVKNEKGKITMQKVKVTRYVTGKKPTFAGVSSSESSGESEDDEGFPFKRPQAPTKEKKSERKSESSRYRESSEVNDPRWRRLQNFKDEEEDDDDPDSRFNRHRRIHEPEIVTSQKEEVKEVSSDDEDDDRKLNRPRAPRESSDEDDQPQDEEFELRRSILRRRAQERQKHEEELLVRQQEDEESSEESSEYEESSSEEEDTAPRLKPVFVRKRDRITLQEAEKEQERIKDLQLEQKKIKDDQKKHSNRMVEDIVRKEVEMEKRQKEDNLDLNSVQTDDENEELAYETWKVRELKRIKRDREEREQMAKEKAEYERIHNMSEEERRAFLRANPKVVTNKQVKGKYKYLQKYFHRGVFFLDEEDEVFKRNFAEPTLEDRFDKTVLPQVMQVKDFGKASRTKWTHLVNEDTTDFQSPWVAESAQNLKFYNQHAAAAKEVFTRPSAKKQKKF